MRIPKKLKLKDLKALNQDGHQFHWEDMPLVRKKPDYIKVSELPKHTLFCECGTCAVKPKHYRKAFDK